MRFILILFLITFLVGCQSINNETTERDPSKDNELIQVRNTSPTEKEQLTNNEIANHLANVAGEVKDVNDTASVVVGPYTVVGIDINENLDRQRVGTVKYSVTEALRDDPYGKTAVVIADGDLLERFRQMGTDIQEGRPVQGVIEELAEIVNRYMPTIPVEDGVDREENEPNHLPDEDEDKLRDIQEEQSDDTQ